MPGPLEVWSDVLDFLSHRSGRLVAQGVVLTGVVAATLAFANAGSLIGSLDQGTTQVQLNDAARSAVVADLSRLPAAAGAQITLTVDGTTRSITTQAVTVATLLAEQRVALGRADQLSVPATATVTPGMTIGIVRVSTRRVVATEPLPFRTTRTKTSALKLGTTKVLTEGVPGEQRVTYLLTYADGKQVGRTRLSAEVSKQPVAAKIQVGSAPKLAVPSSGGSSGSSGSGSSDSSGSGSSTGTKADGLNWAALAKCESGGNPRAVNPAGYYGLYQFSLSTWRSVGGSGNPIDASPAEQLKRAKILYNKAGAGQWGCGRHLFD